MVGTTLTKRRVRYGDRLDKDKIFEWSAGIEDLREHMQTPPLGHISRDCRPVPIENSLPIALKSIDVLMIRVRAKFAHSS
jgi:hypothetical protein